jgi:hypothetical protein
MPLHRDMRIVIVTLENDAVPVIAFVDLKVGVMMNAGKQPASDERVQP